MERDNQNPDPAGVDQPQQPHGVSGSLPRGMKDTYYQDDAEWEGFGDDL